MVTFASTLASQIGSLIASLNPTNSKTVAAELSQLTELYGSDGSVILLRTFLEQVDVREGNTRHSQLKLQLFTLALEKLIELPNFATILNYSLLHIKSPGRFVADLLKAIKLPAHRRVALGLALIEAEDSLVHEEGVKLLETELSEFVEDSSRGLSVNLFQQLLLYVRKTDITKVDIPSFVKNSLLLQNCSDTSGFILSPVVYDEVGPSNCLRSFAQTSILSPFDMADMESELISGTHPADVMEEIGYDCTASVQNCIEVFSRFPTLSEVEIARIVGMVARTHTGLEDGHGSQGTLSTALGSSFSGADDPGSPSHWNLEVLLKAIQQIAPSTNWSSVLEHLDHETFSLPDHKAFTVLLSVYNTASTDVFPLTAICGRIWNNAEGQLSFLRYATAAPPELFTFAHSLRTQPPVDGLHGHKSSIGTPNQAWLSLDLLEILCRLAEAGHVAAVRSILDYPLKHCPEVLLLGLAQVKTELNLVQGDILSMLLPTYLANNPNSSTVLHLLWPLNREVVMKAMVDAHSKDSSQVSRILDVCQDLKVLSVVLDSTPFSFAIDLAALASRREYLNLEKWLQDTISIHKDALFQACLTFLKERTVAEPRPDGPGGIGQRSSPVNLSLETTAIFFRVLQNSSSLLASRELNEEMKMLLAAALRANPRLHSVGNPEQVPTEVFAGDIEEEANSYFQKIYNGHLAIDDFVDMLKRFNRSTIARVVWLPLPREQEIFACMIQSLFDEYRFFSRYPEKELVITAILFGSLIKHQLVSSITLGIALRCVLDALRKSSDKKMFQFGLKALEQFKDRLVEWPQYCNHILQISHMRDEHVEVLESIERTLNRFSAGQTELLNSSSSLEQQQAVTIQAMTSGIGFTAETGESASLQSSVIAHSLSESVMDDDIKKVVASALPAGQDDVSGISVSQAPILSDNRVQSVQSIEGQPIDSQEQPLDVARSAKQQQQLKEDGEGDLQSESTNTNLPAGSLTVSTVQQVEQVSKLQTTQVILQLQPSQLQGNGQPQAPKQEMLRSSRPGAGGITGRPTTTTGFGHALNIETLVAAAEKRESPIQVPGSEIQDKVAFIINNLSISNLEIKAKEVQELLTDEYSPWFAQYMVMKRASIEPNFHDLYLKFLDKMGNKTLLKEVQKATYENCKVLLRSELIKSSSEERSLLKNLGSWMGKLTIGRNQALRAREIDPKSLIIEAYEKGLMIAIIPFTSKILEPCSSSLAYQPPNPWTMGILGLLTEIYNLPNLKMNLKFDIEVLFKNLSVDIKDIKPTQLLKGRQREIEGNPDFSNKDLSGHHQPTAPLPQDHSVSGPPALPVQLEATVPAPSTVSVPAQPPTSVMMPSATPVLSQVETDEKALVAPSGAVSSAIDRSTTSPSPSQPYSMPPVPMSIPNNLAAYIVFNPKLGALSQQLQLPRIVPIAMERAIREIISPVVERSVTIACMTTRELVMKDYAMEADESRTHKAANLMVASLSGSLAHVTCKEPLRVAMANHLRSLLQAAGGGAEVEQAVQLITNDNLDLGCAVIEKAATEKALRDLEENLAHPLALRRKQRESLGAAFYDASIYSQGSLARLPEALRPKPGRLAPAQQRVYEDFARLPWQNNQAARAQQGVPPSSQQVTSQPAPASTPTPAPATVPAASTASRMGYNASTELRTGFPSGPQVPPSVVPQSEAGTASELERPSVPPVSSSLPSGGISTGAEPSRASLETAIGLFPSAPSGPVENPQVETVSPKLSPSSTSLDQLSVEPSLTTGEAIEKYQFVIYKLDMAISKTSPMPLTNLPVDHEIRVYIAEVQEVITQCISRDEAALAIAQKVFKRLYENATNVLHVSAHLAILESIREVCKRVVKELTNWVIYSDEERKLNREITVGLIQSELINLADYNIHLAKLMDGGRNAMATDFAVHLVKACVIQENLVGATELYNVIDSLAKIAQRPGAPESLQQLVELARNSTAGAVAQGGVGATKDDKARPLKDKKVIAVRGAGSKDEGKPNARDVSTAIPPAFREQVMAVFDEWARICDTSANNDKAYAMYMSQIQHSGLLKNDEVAERFFRTLTEIAVSHCLNSETTQVAGAGPPSSGLTFTVVDMYARLVVLLVKYYVDPGNTAMSKINLLNKVLMVAVKVLLRDADEKKTVFNSKPFFRLFVTWLMDLNSPDPILDSSNFQVLTGFATTFQALQPLRVPAFSFAWLELVSHRVFMPKLLLANQQKGWPWFQRLLVALFKFMEPYLRNAELSDPVRLLYKGTLRVLLVLLHDFPEFLCDHHFSFCDVIPPSCIQMRNLILSAFPRNMRLPDPFTPNLKVDLLPEISQQPRILSDVEAVLRNKQLKTEVDEYLKTREPISFLAVDLKQRLMLPQAEAVQCGTRYNVPLINALVLFVGMQAIQQLQSKSTPQQLAVPTAPITHSAPMDIFQRLITDLDTEGRYLFLNAIANQLRYPNNHTHYFSCVLLYLFAEAQQEIIQEQITRVLLERLIVNRPHPWGLLITFIELIKNPRYNFWSHSFTRCAPEIEKLFESVARSCMGPPPKAEEDLPQNMGSEQLKL